MPIEDPRLRSTAPPSRDQLPYGRLLFVITVALCFAACSNEPSPSSSQAAEELPAILLVTLDTTRADRLGIESEAAQTPHLDALAARGTVFSHAYSTAPTTLPAHTSMLTGLYPVVHGVHENARYLSGDQELISDHLKRRGYTTAAFISGFPLAQQFGLARGFDHYDDDFGDAVERSADRTTRRALAYLQRPAADRLFLWVHYYDPHDPYAPPEPFQDVADPYDGEITFMDHELGRLLAVFQDRYASAHKILIVGDHGEALGDHGEVLHGNLLYQGVMRVPLIVAGTGVGKAVEPQPVSTRRVFHTLLDWAGEHQDLQLLSGVTEPVLGEAMKPHLQYGWQPQVMAVQDRLKIIRSGETEIYDVVSDPAEAHNLSGRVEPDRALLAAVSEYLSQPLAQQETATLDQETRERLASLGYASWQGQVGWRKDAPNPKDMAHLFAELDAGSAAFVRREYDLAIRVFERVLAQDPENLMVCLRLAVAHSTVGRGDEAMRFFARAREIAPDSIDRQHYLAMHLFRSGAWREAEPLFEKVLTVMPRRLPALEALARLRERQGRNIDASALLERVISLKKEPVGEWLKLGERRMATGDTTAAILAFERARQLQPGSFSHDLELGVCYLANHQVPEAREALDQVPPSHPGYAMALFKRAQVSVLLGEADRLRRIRKAYEQADRATRPLIEREPLFRDAGWLAKTGS